MVPSSASIAGPNVVLNIIAAEALDEIATRLEKASNKSKEISAIVKETVNQHDRIIFNGNNYIEEWVKEAKKRGLPNIQSTVEALKALVTEKAGKLFEKYKVLTKEELHSRYEVYLEQYAKQINIEALTAIEMVKRQYIPATICYTSRLARAIQRLKEVSVPATVQKELLSKVSDLLASANKKLASLENATKKAQNVSETYAKAVAYRDTVFKQLGELREDIDALETLVPTELWPVPSYADMLFKF